MAAYLNCRRAQHEPLAWSRGPVSISSTHAGTTGGPMVASMLNGQTALVTGADRGIGRAIAVALASHGASVVVNHLPGDDPGDVLGEIAAAGAKGCAHAADVTDEAQVGRMISTAVDRMGDLDILINNAGIQMDAPFLDMTLDQWRRVLDVNLTGAFLCAREAAKVFCRRGVVEARSAAAGKMVFISSVHQRIPWAGRANYAASKGGMKLLMETLAQELAPHRIRVNGIAPGAIKTDINRDAWEAPERAAELRRLIPYDRIGDPHDIGRAAAWLCSDDADYVTGATLFVDGGLQLYPAFAAGLG
jgi:glucose 1-dehydrogenase